MGPVTKQWYWKGTAWTLVPGMPVTMPIFRADYPLYFKNMDLRRGGISNLKVSTSTGEADWTLNLIHHP